MQLLLIENTAFLTQPRSWRYVQRGNVIFEVSVSPRTSREHEASSVNKPVAANRVPNNIIFLWQNAVIR